MTRDPIKEPWFGDVFQFDKDAHTPYPFTVYIAAQSDSGDWVGLDLSPDGKVKTMTPRIDTFPSLTSDWFFIGSARDGS